MDDFEEYKRQGEPDKKEKSGIWRTAIGLQQVDGLTPSEYLIKTAKRNIEGEISIYEAQEFLDGYYKAKPAKSADGDRTEEADKVSARIAEILSEKTFTFSPAEYITIHKRLFAGIYKHAGKIRAYNISKSEWVLNGETVYYASADSIRAALNYDFTREKSFDYRGLTKEAIASRIAKFISGLWQIHAFGEGNTRTTAVFAIKYLRTLGFSVENDLFAENSWYFRNALVRANYNDYAKNIFATPLYLNRFFGNLLLGESNALKNREMRVTPAAAPDTANGINDTVNQANDTVNRENDTVNRENDTVNQGNDTVNQGNDTVNQANDTVNQANDTVNQANDTVNQENDTVNQANDTVNQGNDTVNQGNDTVNRENDTVNQGNDTVNRGNDTVNDGERSVLSLIGDDPSVTAAQLAERLGVSLITVRREIRRLKDGGYIKRVGSDKTGRWVTAKD
ncbi:MAG: Fic family protein [Clostridiales bacterium]|nr:Fic family protein [Clostridiales bacterium]